MAVSQTPRVRGGRFAVAHAVFLLTSAGVAQAQNLSPPAPAAEMPGPSLGEIVDAEAVPVETPAPMTMFGPTSHPAYC
jgi:hypothetical protein